MNGVQADCTGAARDYQVGELRVWRGWRIDSLGRLTGIQYPTVWRPDDNEAICRRGQESGTYTLFFGLGPWGTTTSTSTSDDKEPKHDAPHDGCTCGMYCYYDRREEIKRYGINRLERNVVFGIAEVWGRVLIGEKGLRAQHARPVAVVHPRSHWDRWRFRRTVEAERYQRMLRNYPSVTEFRSTRAAVAAMPLWAPTFEVEDPLFWERAAS